MIVVSKICQPRVNCFLMNRARDQTRDADKPKQKGWSSLVLCQPRLVLVRGASIASDLRPCHPGQGGKGQPAAQGLPGGDERGGLQMLNPV